MDRPDDEDFGRKCLLARRLVERGVRFIQIYSGGAHNDDNWDAHTDIVSNHSKHAGRTDKPIAGLIKDLKRRGLLDQTLIVWGGEFGRQPTAEYAKGTGRDHNSFGFTMWLAGGGIKGGTARNDRRAGVHGRRGPVPRQEPARDHPDPAWPGPEWALLLLRGIAPEARWRRSASRSGRLFELPIETPWEMEEFDVHGNCRSVWRVDTPCGRPLAQRFQARSARALIETQGGVLLVPLGERELPEDLAQELEAWQELTTESWAVFKYEEPE